MHNRDKFRLYGAISSIWLISLITQHYFNDNFYIETILNLSGLFLVVNFLILLIHYFRNKAKSSLVLPASDLILLSGSDNVSIEAENSYEEELYQKSVTIVLRAGKATTSMLQRRLKIGYARAARLIDLMEENGIVGPPNETYPREVYPNAHK